MKKRFQKTAAIVMSVILATILTACGSLGGASAGGENGQSGTDGGVMTEEPGAKAPGDKKKKIELTGMVQQSKWYFGPQKVVEKLEADENIVIEFEMIPDDQHDNLMRMRLDSHGAPDLTAYQFADLPATVNPEEFFIPVDGETRMPDVTVLELTEYNGKRYGYCFKASNGFQELIYNEDVSAEHGIIELPKIPEELYGTCDKLKKEGVTLIAIPSDTWVSQIWMTPGMVRALGADEMNEEFTEETLTNQAKFSDYPEMAVVIDEYLDLFKKRYTNEDFTTVGYDEILGRLAGGEITMTYGATKILTSIEESYPDSDLTILNPPAGYNGKDVLVYPPTAIGVAANKDMERLDMIKKIFEVWSMPEYGSLCFKSRPGSSNIKGIDGNELVMNLDIPKIYPEYMESERVVAQVNQYIDMLQPLFGNTLWVYPLEAPSKGNMGGVAVLGRFQKDVEKFMTEKGTESWKQGNAVGSKG